MNDNLTPVRRTVVLVSGIECSDSERTELRELIQCVFGDTGELRLASAAEIENEMTGQSHLDVMLRERPDLLEKYGASLYFLTREVRARLDAIRVLLLDGVEQPLLNGKQVFEIAGFAPLRDWLQKAGSKPAQLNPEGGTHLASSLRCPASFLAAWRAAQRT